MTDLERKLAEALRGQAREVTPNLDAAWVEQQRRQRRPAKSRRRRVAVWGAPLAAMLVVLTSVLLATQLRTSSAPAPPAKPGEPLMLAKPEHLPMSELENASVAVPVMDFVGQSDAWTAHAFFAKADGIARFCVAATPKNVQFSPDVPQYGPKSPMCVRTAGGGSVVAGYVGEDFGPLPSGTAVYIVSSSTVQTLRLYDADGSLSEGRKVNGYFSDSIFLADVNPDSPPVRFQVS